MKTKYIRSRATITEIESGKKVDYKTTNKAKKESHKIQMQNGGLGLGSVMIK